jgi:hypothetical protein
VCLTCPLMRTLRLLRTARARSSRCCLVCSPTSGRACLLGDQPTCLPMPRRRYTRALCSRTRPVRTSCPHLLSKSFVLSCFPLFLNKCTSLEFIRVAERPIDYSHTFSSTIIITPSSTKSILIPIMISLFLSSTNGCLPLCFFFGYTRHL